MIPHVVLLRALTITSPAAGTRLKRTCVIELTAWGFLLAVRRRTAVQAA